MKLSSPIVFLINVLVLVGVCCRPTLAQQNIAVEVNTRNLYLRGLPIVVSVDIVNHSDSVQAVPAPSVEDFNLYYKIKKSDEKAYLKETINFSPGVIGKVPTISLNPGAKTSTVMNMARNFVDDLPPGQYICEVLYSMGGGTTLRSKPVSFSIVEARNHDEDRALYVAMIKFLAAKTYLLEPDQEIAYRLFLEVRSDGEYGRSSYYYLAILEKDPKKKMQFLRDFLDNPPDAFSGLLETDHFRFLAGSIFFKGGDFAAAKAAFLKMRERHKLVEDYLSKIEIALKTPH